MTQRTVIEELVTVLGFELDSPGLQKALQSYTDLHNLAADVITIAKELGEKLLEPIKRVVEVGTEAIRMSTRLGIGVETFQELNEAAKLAGVSTEGLVHGMQHLIRTQYEATHGHKEQAQAYANLGVSLYGTNGKLKQSDALLGDIAEQLQKHPERRALLFNVMGRGAGEMLPLLLKGKDGLKEFIDIARDTGQILSEDVARSAKELGFSWRILTMYTEGLTRRLGAGLIPIAGRVVATMLAWWKANRLFIQQRIDQTVELVTRAINPLYQALRVIWATVNTVVEAFGGWQNILYVLAGLLGFQVLSAVGKFAMGLGDATSALVRFFSVMFAGGLIPALVGAALLALAVIIGLVIQDLRSSDSLIKQLFNEGENPEDTPLIRWFKMAINFSAALVRTLKGVVHLASAGVNAVTSYVTGFGSEESKKLAQEAWDEITGGGSIEGLAGIKNVNTPPALSSFAGGSGGQTSFGAQSFGGVTVNQTFNGPADPAQVKNASELGVQKGAQDLQAEQRKQTYNSGARAGYR